MRVNGLEGLGPRRKRAGLTQEEFAGRLGCKRSILAMWETGQTWPSARWLPLMAKLLGCGIVDLYIKPEDEAVNSIAQGEVPAP